MPDKDHMLSNVAEQKNDLPAPDLYTGEPPLQSAHNTWNKVRKDLAYALGANIHRSWTGRLRVATANDRTVDLSAPTRFIASKIQTNYAETVRRLWKKHDMVEPARDVTFSSAAGRPSTATKPTVKLRNKGDKQIVSHSEHKFPSELRQSPWVTAREIASHLTILL